MSQTDDKFSASLTVDFSQSPNATLEVFTQGPLWTRLNNYDPEVYFEWYGREVRMEPTREYPDCVRFDFELISLGGSRAEVMCLRIIEPKRSMGNESTKFHQQFAKVMIALDGEVVYVQLTGSEYDIDVEVIGATRGEY